MKSLSCAAGGRVEVLSEASAGDCGAFDTQKKRPGIFLLIVARLVPGSARGVVVDGFQRSAKDERMREKMGRRNTNYIVVILLTGIGLEKW